MALNCRCGNPARCSCHLTAPYTAQQAPYYSVVPQQHSYAWPSTPGASTGYPSTTPYAHNTPPVVTNGLPLQDATTTVVNVSASAISHPLPASHGPGGLAKPHHSGSAKRAAEIEPGSDGNRQSKEATLPDEVYNALLARVNSLPRTSDTTFDSIYDSSPMRRPRLHNKGQFVSSWEVSGAVFGTRSSSLRNSFIVFSPRPSHSSRTEHSAGQITDIFLHGRIEEGQRIVQPMFVVEEYCPLSELHASRDPYRRYPDLQTRMYYNTFQGATRLVTLEQIQSHFAAYVYTPPDIDTECIVVRSLDRS
ncbi:hypothetical protein NUW54_g13364 [Trametes sanguinea]|uniref:Uncharacterized protein n=1 Tax=Trametes sanguinea TaxID=158606 RepID=A0ACC1MMP4_9APHY|nr:hypothetical protein NUW54_g13364 [Trametes sanguinea]